MITPHEKEAFVKVVRRRLFDTIGGPNLWKVSDVRREVVKAITQGGLAVTLDEAIEIIRAVRGTEQPLELIDAARDVLDAYANDHPTGIVDVESFWGPYRTLGRLINWEPPINKGSK